MSAQLGNRTALPDARHTVPIEERVGAHQFNLIGQRLRGKETIERIAVMVGQRGLGGGVFDGDWE